MRVWARVLDAVPGSRLVVKATLFRDEWVRGLYQDRFAAAGVPADRLTILPPVMEKAGHLAAYAEVDIALDPFPYNGTTTTCEALWMGVPVVTLAGQVHAGRVGASLLTRAGLPDLIAGSEDEYVAIARGLAMDTPRLGSLRSSLRTAVSATLRDAAPVVKALEQAYRDMSIQLHR
jgi:predicted O-linked N-acetylglucosamine transferase (SPINDLY family)